MDMNRWFPETRAARKLRTWTEVARALAVCLLCTSTSAGANAGGNTTSGSAAITYRACSLSLAPKTMPDAHGRPSGAAVEALQAVAQELGWAVQIDYMPWLRVVSEARQGRCDIVLTVLRRSDYEEFLHFPSEPVLHHSNVLVVRRGSGIRYDGDLKAFMHRHSIGLYADKAVDDAFEALRRAPQVRVETAPDPSLNLEKLLAGRFDAAIENDMTATYLLRQSGRLADVEILRPALNAKPAFIAFPKSGRLAAQVDVFGRALGRVRQTEAFKQRLGHWGAQSH